MKKLIDSLVWILAMLVGGVIGSTVVHHYLDRRIPSKLEEALISAERQVNAMAPKMVDDATRLDGAKAGPGREFTYIYTLVALTAAEVDRVAWKRDVVPMVRKNMRVTPGMRNLFRSGTTVRYRYLGKDGTMIDEIVMAPAEGLAH